MAAEFSLKGGIFAVMESHTDYIRNAKITEFKSCNFASLLKIEFKGWGFENLPMRVQNMILRQVRIAQKWRTELRVPPDMVVIPGWTALVLSSIEPAPEMPSREVAAEVGT
jgi:hypothetical protein